MRPNLFCLAVLCSSLTFSSLFAAEKYVEISKSALKAFVEKAENIEARIELNDGRIIKGILKSCDDGIALISKAHVSLSKKDDVIVSDCFQLGLIKRVEIKRKSAVGEEALLIFSIIFGIVLLGNLFGR